MTSGSRAPVRHEWFAWRTGPSPMAEAMWRGAGCSFTLSAGRWTSGNSEVVLSQQFADNAGVRIGDRLTAGGGSPLPAMSVVGIATGVGREPDGWTAAAGVPLVTSGKFQTTYLME